MKIIILAAAATSALAAGLSHDPCNIKLPITTYKSSSEGGVSRGPSASRLKHYTLYF